MKGGGIMGGPGGKGAGAAGGRGPESGTDWGGAGGDIPQHSRQLLPGARIWVQFPSTHMMAHMCGYPQFQGSDTLQ